MTKRECWIAFKVNGELQEAKAAASCFTCMPSITSAGTYMSKLS